MSQNLTSTRDKVKVLESHVKKADILFEKRFLHFAFNSLGKNTEVKLKDKSKASGTFYTTNQDNGGVVLKNFNVGGQGAAGSTKVLDKNDFVYMLVQDCEEPPVIKPKVTREVFKTDTEISNKKEFFKRNLVKWEHDNTFQAPSGGNFGSLEDDGAHTNDFCQFEANNAKFGIQSDFEEHHYTTKIDMNNVDKSLLERAERVEREIQGSTSEKDSRHIREERGLLSQQEEVDEEELYSSVIRENEKKSQAPLPNQKPKPPKFVNSKKKDGQTEDPALKKNTSTDQSKASTPGGATTAATLQVQNSSTPQAQKNEAMPQGEKLPTPGLNRQASAGNNQQNNNRQQQSFQNNNNNLQNQLSPGKQNQKGQNFNYNNQQGQSPMGYQQNPQVQGNYNFQQQQQMAQGQKNQPNRAMADLTRQKSDDGGLRPNKQSSLQQQKSQEFQRASSNQGLDGPDPSPNAKNQKPRLSAKASSFEFQPGGGLPQQQQQYNPQQQQNPNLMNQNKGYNPQMQQQQQPGLANPQQQQQQHQQQYSKQGQQNQQQGQQNQQQAGKPNQSGASSLNTSQASISTNATTQSQTNPPDNKLKLQSRQGTQEFDEKKIVVDMNNYSSVAIQKFKVKTTEKDIVKSLDKFFDQCISRYVKRATFEPEKHEHLWKNQKNKNLHPKEDKPIISSSHSSNNPGNPQNQQNIPNNNNNMNYNNQNTRNKSNSGPGQAYNNNNQFNTNNNMMFQPNMMQGQAFPQQQMYGMQQVPMQMNMGMGQSAFYQNPYQQMPMINPNNPSFNYSNQPQNNNRPNNYNNRPPKKYNNNNMGGNMN